MDLFDLLIVHEDGYTNLLKYLYENVDSFKEKFLKLIFNKDNLNNITFKTRYAYIHDQDENKEKSIAKKSVPDIILYDENHFCIIEVKVFASEGENQTSRYYEAKDEIMNILKITVPEENQRYYFLSLETNAKLSSPKFVSIGWERIGDCLKGSKSDDVLVNSIIDQLIERIQSIKGHNVTNESNWIETIKGEKWSLATDLEKALTFNRRQCYSYNWASFKKASNEYSLSTYILPFEEWENFSLKDQDGSYYKYDAIKTDHPELYYSIHNEFEYNPENKYLSFRLDYELNPYHSKKEIEYIDDEKIREFIKICGEYRKTIARDYKDTWNKNYSVRLKNCGYEDLHYNGRITDNLLTLVSGKIKIEDNWTVSKVNEAINPFMEETAKFVNEVLLPEIKKQSIINT